MSQPTGQSSDLVEIAKRNGDFRKNYGLVLGALLYLRSLSLAAGRQVSWFALPLSIAAGAWALLARYGWPGCLGP
jgi:hypothetical protein